MAAYMSSSKRKMVPISEIQDLMALHDVYTVDDEPAKKIQCNKHYLVDGCPAEVEANADARQNFLTGNWSLIPLVDDLSVQIDTLNFRANEKDNEVKALDMKMTKENEVLKKENAELKKEITELKKENKELRKDMKELKNDMAEKLSNWQSTFDTFIKGMEKGGMTVV